MIELVGVQTGADDGKPLAKVDVPRCTVNIAVPPTAGALNG